ncbi:MAG: long-chain fatty acid--CoA ligase, partial [Chloroflexi bacterium]|nr:long-chain fatty acid--CoA ligase [Chloroflexota bacterium]
MNEKRTTTQQATGADDTLPKLLLRNYRLWGNTRVALRKKRRGIWEEYTWENCYQQVKSIFHGMIGLGLEPGDKVVILGDSGLTWFWGELAVQAAGGRVIGISPALSPSEIKPLFQHAQPRFALVRDQEQVDKLLEIEKDIPSVKKIIYWNEKGLRHYTNPLLMSLANMVKAGEDIQKSRAGSFEEKVAQASA